jgi:hypothetical protein
MVNKAKPINLNILFIEVNYHYLNILLSNQLSKLATVGGLRIILLLLSSKKIVGELDT